MLSKPFLNYIVYENGDVFSNYRNKFLKHVIVGGYHQVKLYLGNGEDKWFKVHRLVGMLFLPLPDNYENLQINHKDGNKDNNHYSNLEWCTSYENNKHARETGLNDIKTSNSVRWQNPAFREKTSNKISATRKNQGLSAGSKNPRFKYQIKDSKGNILTRQELFKKVGCYKNMSSIDACLHKAGQGEVVPVFEKLGIHITNVKLEGQSTIESIRKEKPLTDRSE